MRLGGHSFVVYIHRSCCPSKPTSIRVPGTRYTRSIYVVPHTSSKGLKKSTFHSEEGLLRDLTFYCLVWSQCFGCSTSCTTSYQVLIQSRETWRLRTNIIEAGSRQKRNIPPSGNKTMNTLKITTQSISTWPHQQKEYIGEVGFGVRAVAGEIWVLIVLLVEALLHRDLIAP